MAFEIAIGKRGWSAVAGARHEDDVEVVFLDEAVQVNPNERLAGIGAPMAEQPAFEMFRLKWFAQQWICAKVDHAR